VTEIKVLLLTTATLAGVSEEDNTMITLPGMLAQLRRFISAAATGIIAVALFAPAPAMAGYTRSCKGTYVVYSRSTSAHAIRRVFTGKADDNMSPNRARQTARSKMERCTSDHWHARTAASPPATCWETNGIYDYPFNSLERDITTLVCAVNPEQRSIMIDVEVQYDGNTGCIRDPNIWSLYLARNYQINCVRGRLIKPRLPQLSR
jgi:hypothetical protein